MSTLLLLATALVLGAAHSFAPDHLAAIGVFVSRRPDWRRALTIGAGWGVGHSLVIALVGGALVLTGWRFPAHFAPMMERLVGVTLIVLGIVALARAGALWAGRVHAHVHEHEGAVHWHLHSHRRTDSHDHAHRAALGIGMLHGLAGTGALVIALPFAAADSVPLALAYLVAFGIGTTFAMATFGGIAGWAVRRAGGRSTSVLRAAASFAALASVVVGVWWTLAAG
jgi:sulfite exporter TauE/SafE